MMPAHSHVLTNAGPERALQRFAVKIWRMRTKIHDVTHDAEASGEASGHRLSQFGCPLSGKGDSSIAKKAFRSTRHHGRRAAETSLLVELML